MFKLNCFPMFEGNSDGGGGDATAKALEAAETAAKIATAATAKVDELSNQLVTMKTDTDLEIKSLAQDAVLATAKLESMYGKSGAKDWNGEMHKFVRALYHVSKGRPVPEGMKIHGQDAEQMFKTLIEFSTTTAATAGYLVPDILQPGINEIRDTYGSLYPVLPKVKIAAGTSLLLNSDAAVPVAAWQLTQNGILVEEPTPMSFGQETLLGALCYVWITAANELINNPVGDFVGVAVARMLRAINKQVEFGFVAGTAAGVYRSNGLIADATAQTTMATMTWDLFRAFLVECITDNDNAGSTTNTIMMTKQDAVYLAAAKVDGSLLTWGDPAAGVPAKIMGYNLITHPACNDGSNKYVILADLEQTLLTEDPATAIDISDSAGDSFIKNQSTLRVLNHYDWSTGQSAMLHAAVVTA